MSDKSTISNTETISRRTVLSATAAAAAGAALAPGQANAQERDDLTMTGKVVVISGATSGIGKATAELFAAHGATVVFNGRRKNLGKAVERSIKDAGGTATYVKSDVRDPKQVKAFLEGAVRRHGKIDIAVNNAGIAIPPGPVEAVDPEQYRDIMATNLDGVFWSLHHEVRLMKASGGGVIVNTSSAFGEHAADNQVAYGATKSAVDAMTRAVAKEAGGAGIRVVAMAPGAIKDTDLFRFIGRAWTDDEIAHFGTLASIGRAGTPQEMAALVVALAGDPGAFVHGTIIRADGQFLAS